MRRAAAAQGFSFAIAVHHVTGAIRVASPPFLYGIYTVDEGVADSTGLAESKAAAVTIK